MLTLVLLLILFWSATGFLGALTLSKKKSLSTNKFIMYTLLGLITIYTIVIFVYRDKL
jgi:hypothetical protein